MKAPLPHLCYQFPRTLRCAHLFCQLGNCCLLKNNNNTRVAVHFVTEPAEEGMFVCLARAGGGEEKLKHNMQIGIASAVVSLSWRCIRSLLKLLTLRTLSPVVVVVFVVEEN